MAHNEVAPKLDREFLQKLVDRPELFSRLQTLAFSDREYNPWRHVKYHTPEGIDPQDMWKALLIARNGRPVASLTDGSGHAFTLAHPESLKRRVDQVYRALNYSTSTDSPFKGLDERHRRMYLQRSLAEEAISSSQLEGAVTTREVAREMILSKRTPEDASERMILNNYLTMERLREWKDQSLSLKMLLEMHSQLTEGVLDDSKRGRFRRNEDHVVVYDARRGEVVHLPPSATDIETRLLRIVDFANADDDSGEYYYAIEKAAILHFMIGYEHPFCDGNGRTARALFYWYLLRKNWWLVEFLSISSLLKTPLWRKRYEEAYVDVETCGNDLTYFVLLQMDCLCEAARVFHDYIDRVQQEDHGLTEALKGVLNVRQLDLWRHAKRHPGYRYSAAEHSAWHKISLNTARTDLEGLRKKGFLVLEMRGKTRTYHVKDSKYRK